jgi:hypothetical protein
VDDTVGGVTTDIDDGDAAVVIAIVDEVATLGAATELVAAVPGSSSPHAMRTTPNPHAAIL